MNVDVHLFECIRHMARAGYGYDDIAVKLKLLPRQVRPFVIGGKHVSLSSMRREAAANEREAEEL